jgi:hypothetical protein
MRTDQRKGIAKTREGKSAAVLIGGGVDGESRALFRRTFGTTAKVIDAHPQTVLGDLKEAFPDGK